MPVHVAEAVGETARRPSLPPGSAQDPALRSAGSMTLSRMGSKAQRRRGGGLMAKREVIDLQRDADEARSGVAKSEAARRHLERFKQGEIDRWGATPASLPRWATSMSSVHRSHGRRFASPRNRWQLCPARGMAVGLWSRASRSRSRRSFEIETTTPQHVFVSPARRKREHW